MWILAPVIRFKGRHFAKQSAFLGADKQILQAVLDLPQFILGNQS